MKRIYLSPPHLTEEALLYLQDAVNSNWIAPVGPHVDAFEHELASALQVDHVLATNSGTSAIHLGLLALGVCAGDEVLCSTFTFCASANPIIYCGAVPVFVDSETECWNMDPGLLEDAILDRIKATGRKPKAIVLVHLYGMPARIDEIIEICHKYDIAVLEDAAEAMGSLYSGRQVGTFGDVGVVSFNGNKIVTTSGGGALFSFKPAMIQQARFLGKEAQEPLPHYEHKSVGYNYRLSNLLAAVGRSQLKVLDERIKKRRAIFDYYKQNLTGLPVTFQSEAENIRSNRWLTVLQIAGEDCNPDILRTALAKNEIESRPAWKPMHLQPVFKAYPAYANGVSEHIFKRGLCLPSGSDMEEGDIARVVEVVKSVFK